MTQIRSESGRELLCSELISLRNIPTFAMKTKIHSTILNCGHNCLKIQLQTLISIQEHKCQYL